MKGRFFKFLVIGLILGLFFVASSDAKGLKLFSKPQDKAKSVQPAKPAKSEANQPPAVPVYDAKIKFDSLEHNFGNVGPESDNSCKFTFTNIGKKGTLKIESVHGTCKCTVPDLKKKEYAPGESGEITVQFRAPKFKGETSQRIVVSTNEPNNPRTELEIKANVKPEVEVTPEQITLSLIDPNVVSQITLVSDDNERFAVTRIIVTGDVVSIPFDPTTSLKSTFSNLW